MDHIPIPSDENLDYSSYLKVKELLSLQQTLSNPECHDEHLFILIHQSYELWFKQIIHELNFSIRQLGNNHDVGFLKTLERIIVIQRVLNEQIDILETMTPNDFNLFRGRLRPASGFQSYQFRAVEMILGKRNPGYMKFFANHPEFHKSLSELFSRPSLYDHFLKFCSKKGLKIPENVLNREFDIPYAGDIKVQEILAHIYLHPDENQVLYRILEAMIDLDEKISLWRYRHVLMVQRMIGKAMGTGGSSGYNYLSATLSERFFVDLWEVRDQLSKGVVY